MKTILPFSIAVKKSFLKISSSLIRGNLIFIRFQFCFSHTGRIAKLKVDVKFYRTDTGELHESHYTLHGPTFPDESSSMLCFNLIDQLFEQNHLVNTLKMNKLKQIYVRRIRLEPAVLNSDVYLDNIWIGKQKLQGIRLFIFST